MSGSIAWIYKARRPHRLSKLNILEISSVDAGANPHAQVTLMKRDAAPGPRLTEYYKQILRKRARQQENVNMETAPIHQQIRKAAELRETGQVDDYTAALIEQELALKMFPDSPNVGVALNKLYATEQGRRLQKANTTRSYVDLQKKSATGDAYDAVLKTTNDPDPPVGDDDDHSDGRNPWHGAVRLARSTLGDHHPTTRHLLSLHGKWATDKKDGMAALAKKGAPDPADVRVSREHRLEKMRKGIF